jgi:hypothetical protein
MARITISDFNLFLEDNSIFDAFWLEYHRARVELNHKGVSTGVEAYRDFISMNPHRFVRNAFAWVDTPQGSGFWAAIDVLWNFYRATINDKRLKSK